MRLVDGTGEVIPDQTGAMSVLEYGVMPEIDAPSMSVRFRICTAREDHQGDIIEPSGVDWEDYRFNPVVKFEHGFSGIPWPVARSADDNGVLHEEWVADEDAIYARAFFSDKHELSEQCFELIVDGFMRAASIHVMPVPGQFKKIGEDSHHVFLSNQMEWSIATVGVNPDSYAKSLSADSRLSEVLALQLESATRILDKQQIGGRAILPSLAKCLKAVKPPKQALARGHSITEREDMGTKILTQPEIDKLGAVGLAKALASAPEYDADTHKRLTAKAKSLSFAKADGEEYDDEGMAKAVDTEEGEGMAKADEPGEVAPTETAETAVTEEPPATMSPGADFLSALHASISELCAKLDSVEQYTEKPEVQEIAMQMCESIRGELATLEGAFASVYPDQPPLAASEEPADAEMVKSWVHSNVKNSYRLEGLAVRLSQAGSNPSKAKSVIAGVVRDLRLLNSQAKSWKPAQSAESVSQEQFKELASAVDKLTDLIANSPARV